MRVMIDAVPLLIRSAGVKVYLYHWIASLRRAAAGTDSIGTFPALGSIGPLLHERSVANGWRTLTGLAAFALANHTPLPVLDAASRGVDVFHATNLARRPPRRPRLTATIHDLTTWIMPDAHPSANRRADENFASILRRADRLIAVSESTRNDAVRLLRLPGEKITVIHSGVADAFFRVEPAEVNRIRARYELQRPFVLSIGTVEPRKNMSALVAAFQDMPASLREEFELVIAGPMGWAGAATEERVRTVRYLGYVPEKDVAPLTAAATVFAYPSLYEGFGFPVAQAMAAAVPVITSNVSSLPEIAGDAGLLIDPHSHQELRGALVRLLSSPEDRRRLAVRGRQRAEKLFRWEICAARSWQFFRDAAG